MFFLFCSVLLTLTYFENANIERQPLADSETEKQTVKYKMCLEPPKTFSVVEVKRQVIPESGEFFASSGLVSFTESTV